jgi:hypothetical protein
MFFCPLAFTYFMEYLVHFENNARKPYNSFVAGHENTRRIKLCQLLRRCKQLLETNINEQFENKCKEDFILKTFECILFSNMLQIVILSRRKIRP